MTVVVPGFPLLRLPKKALLCVVKRMDILDRISLSLVSKSTKSIVISCGDSIFFISFYMKDVFKVTLTRRSLNLTFFLSQKHKTWDGDNPVELTAADVVQVFKSRTERYKWEKKGFGVKDWIWHFQDISRLRDIHKIVFEKEGERFDVDSVAKTVKPFNITALVVLSECSSKFANSIFEKVHTNYISVEQNLFPQKVALEKALIQNCNIICIQPGVPINLNHLLMMNCEVLDIMHPRNSTMKIFNQFLKFWRTGFNSRLKNIMIMFRPNFAPDKNVILKGIEHLEVTPDRFDFRGANGTRATLLFQNSLNRMMFLVSDGNRIQL